MARNPNQTPNCKQASRKPKRRNPTNRSPPKRKKRTPKRKEKTIEEVTKDFEKLEGLFTLYRKKEAGKDTIYMEIRREQLETLYFLQATVSEGLPTFFLAAGTPINDILFKVGATRRADSAGCAQHTAFKRTRTRRLPAPYNAPSLTLFWRRSKSKPSRTRASAC
jgi:hypothetical protein